MSEIPSTHICLLQHHHNLPRSSSSQSCPPLRTLKSLFTNILICLFLLLHRGQLGWLPFLHRYPISQHGDSTIPFEDSRQNPFSQSLSSCSKPTRTTGSPHTTSFSPVLTDFMIESFRSPNFPNDLQPQAGPDGSPSGSSDHQPRIQRAEDTSSFHTLTNPLNILPTFYLTKKIPCQSLRVRLITYKWTYPSRKQDKLTHKNPVLLIQPHSPTNLDEVSLLNPIQTVPVPKLHSSSTLSCIVPLKAADPTKLHVIQPEGLTI